MPKKTQENSSDHELFGLLAATAREYAVFETDQQGLVQSWNVGAERLLGYSAEEILGQSADCIFTPEDRLSDVPARETRESLESGASTNHRWHIRKDGSRFWSADSVVPLRDEKGGVRGFARVIRDRADRTFHTDATSAILESALDCIITMDFQGNVVEFNPVAERTFGYKRADVIGRDLASLIIPPALRERHYRGLERYLETGEGPVVGKRIELHAMHADGTEFPAELAITRVPSEGPPLFTAYLRDISTRVRNEQLRNVRFAVTQHLTQTPNVEAAASGVLSSVCENLRWDVGLFWLVNSKEDSLECIASWQKPDSVGAAFTAVSKRRTFRRGEGLPGRIWSSGKPAWLVDVRDDPNFLRTPIAVKEGLHSSFACPIPVGNRVLGVIEFYTQHFREPDADLIETMGTIAGHIGQFIERQRTQDTLRQSERELADLFENAAIGLNWIGPDGTILRANRAELDLLGWSEDEYVGQNIANFFADEGVISDKLRRLQAGEHLQDYSTRLCCKDGSIRDVVIHSSALMDEGRFVHSRSFTRDITHQKRAEEALLDSEARFRALMEQAPFSVQMLALDGHTIRVNRAWSELWGAKLEQLENYNMLMDPQLETKGVLPYLRRAFDGEAVSLPTIMYDPNETIPDLSKRIDPVRWVSAVAYPLKDNAGKVLEVVLVHEDRTAQVEADNALRQSEDKLLLLADTIPQLAWMAEADGYIFWYNRRWYDYTGKAPIETEGWGWESVHDPEILPEVLTRWKSSINSGDPFEMIFPLKGADGHFRPFLCRVSPLRGADGRVIYWFGTNTDIGEIKRMEDELRDADRRKDEFLATLAHELRNPLAPIKNSLEILKMPRVEPAMLQATKDMMERQFDHLVRLVDDLLDASRVMRGKIELRKEPVELATALARAVETVQSLMEVQGHRLEISLPPESLLLHADPVRLTQILSNLLTNSAKYTDVNGHIWASASREGAEAVIRVRDNGIGIDTNMLPRVFELFVQVDHGSTKAQGGLGIGLTLVKNLVEMHGGTVQARSAGLGKGSEFILRFPLMGEVKEIREEDEKQGQASPSSGNRVLVVDDNRDAALSLSMLLSLQGYKVEVAYDGPAAVTIAMSWLPDIVFLDLGMPGMDGYEVARRMRSQPGLETVVLTALTGWGQEEDRRRTTEAGFDYHLVKPPDQRALQHLLESLNTTDRPQ